VNREGKKKKDNYCTRPWIARRIRFFHCGILTNTSVASGRRILFRERGKKELRGKRKEEGRGRKEREEAIIFKALFCSLSCLIPPFEKKPRLWMRGVAD